tara:strand:- start:45 stop:344 length:300 start_codon:yes stop_codon:yes gene_type:complete
MKITEEKLRNIIREELKLEFFGFGKKKLPVDSSGNVRIAKLSREQQDIFINIKSAVKKSGRTEDTAAIVKKMGIDEDEHSELIKAAMNAGKIAYSHASR